MPKARMKVDKRCVDAIRRAIEEKLDEACDKVKDEVLPGVAADVIEKSRLEVPTDTGTARYWFNKRGILSGFATATSKARDKR